MIEWRKVSTSCSEVFTSRWQEGMRYSVPFLALDLVDLLLESLRVLDRLATGSLGSN